MRGVDGAGYDALLGVHLRLLGCPECAVPAQRAGRGPGKANAAPAHAGRRRARLRLLTPCSHFVKLAKGGANLSHVFIKKVFQVPTGSKIPGHEGVTLHYSVGYR